MSDQVKWQLKYFIWMKCYECVKRKQITFHAIILYRCKQLLEECGGGGGRVGWIRQSSIRNMNENVETRNDLTKSPKI